MSHLKLKVKLNKGRRGISLSKLEHFIASIRKFLASASEDLDIPLPEDWAGVDFKNGSIIWTNESGTEVPAPMIMLFNDAISQLARGQIAPQVQYSTSRDWYSIFEELESQEEVGFAIFSPNTGRAKWLSVTREVALLPTHGTGLVVRESIGAVQGTVHSWYRASEPPYFMLRESSKRTLIKCFYDEPDYAAVVSAVKEKSQIIHVHGRIYADTRQRCIREIKADRIIPSDPFTFKDFETFWNEGKSH